MKAQRCGDHTSKMGQHYGKREIFLFNILKKQKIKERVGSRSVVETSYAAPWTVQAWCGDYFLASLCLCDGGWGGPGSTSWAQRRPFRPGACGGPLCPAYNRVVGSVVRARCMAEG